MSALLSLPVEVPQIDRYISLSFGELVRCTRAAPLILHETPAMRWTMFVLTMLQVGLVDAAPESAERQLQQFNVAVFGPPSERPVALLLPKREGDIAPESVMVDVGDDRFYAATVSYPKKLTLEQARDSLNRHYKKWERKSFVKDPSMGLWRSRVDKFSIQLSEDEDNIVVIFIKYDILPASAEKKLEDALSQIIQDATPKELESLPDALRDEE